MQIPIRVYWCLPLKHSDDAFKNITNVGEVSKIFAAIKYPNILIIRILLIQFLAH
jgi:hypothetical protein